jgi:hypothetical protein
MHIYEFLYCSCIYESAYSTMSIHKTKSGAYRAMRKFITEEYQKWYDERIRKGKRKFSIQKFGIHEGWFVFEREILD